MQRGAEVEIPGETDGVGERQTTQKAHLLPAQLFCPVGRQLQHFLHVCGEQRLPTPFRFSSCPLNVIQE